MRSLGPCEGVLLVVEFRTSGFIRSVLIPHSTCNLKEGPGDAGRIGLCSTASSNQDSADSGLMLWAFCPTFHT